MHATRQIQHRSQDLVKIFNACFLHANNTQLIGGAHEPIYLPAGDARKHHEVVFTQDYFASALHESAHWFIAGDRRRTLVDYGYWYAPDGRDALQQKAFEEVEVKPQALEWILSEACAAAFRVSADNLNEGLGATDLFRTRIAIQAQKYCSDGIPARSQTFVAALAGYYGVTDPLNPKRYCVERLT